MGKREHLSHLNFLVFFFVILVALVSFFTLQHDTFDELTGFATIQDVPDTPVLDLPLNLSQHVYQSNITFNWTGTDPDADLLDYLFQLSNDTGFDEVNLSSNVTLLDQANYTLDVSNLTLGTYYWRIRSNDSEGNSGFTSPNTLEIVYALINISSPLNNTIITAGSTVALQVNEIESGDLIEGVDLIFTVNGENSTFTASNTSSTDVTNYTYTYSIPNINSSIIDLTAIGYNSTREVNISQPLQLRVTRSFSEAGSPNITRFCGYPAALQANTTQNISVRFSAGVLVDFVNLTITYPNGTLGVLTETVNNFQRQNVTSHDYTWNYTLNTSVTGEHTLRAAVRDLNYPTSSELVSTVRFTSDALANVNWSFIGFDSVDVLDTCNAWSVSSGTSNLTGRLPVGKHDLKLVTTTQRTDIVLANVNLTQSVNTTACNFTDISESISVPSITRAVDQFVLGCNVNLSQSCINVTYNYSSIIATITSESDLEFYKCTSLESCSWSELTDARINQTADTLSSNFTNFSVFMLSEQVTPTGGGVVGGGGGSSGGGASSKLATLDLIKPQSIDILPNQTIRVPITLNNTGQLKLSSIFLLASMEKEGFNLRFGRDFVESLAIGQLFQTYLEITNVGAEPGEYEILITSRVTSPSFQDTTKFFLDLKTEEFAKKESLLDQLEFMHDLFLGNPECLEYTEITEQVAELINATEYDRAQEVATHAIESCQELIGASSPEFNIPGLVRSSLDAPLLVVEIAFLLTLTSVFYYFYKKRRKE